MTTITKNEQTFLTILSYALRGERIQIADLPGDTDWNSLLDTAVQHKVLPLVIHALPADGIPEAAARKRQAVQQVVAQSMRTTAFLELYEAMKDARFMPRVVKGILCRELYPQGDLRPSSDEDLFVSESDFEAYCEFLRNYGMTPTGEITPETYEVGWRKGVLYIELHHRLFGPDGYIYRPADSFFDTAGATMHVYPTEYGKNILSMPPQFNMLYLLLHAHKHFLHCGFGIRQVCDIGLWARKYRLQIDWAWVEKYLRSSHTFGFATAVLGIARYYLDIPLELPKSWHTEQAYCEPLLHDILTGGIYGSADSSRQHSATVTLNAVEADRAGGKRSILPSLFPNRASMEHKYPYIRKYPLLLPLAWSQRILHYLKEHRDNPAASAAIGKERVKLLKFYGIIR